jgi:putative hydrolase of the HAD superfamily
VLFDADGVIQHATDDLESRLARVLGRVPEPLDDFLRQLYAAERPCLIGDADFAERLVPVVARWGAPAAAEALARAWSSIEPDPRVLDVVRGLRAEGVTCALTTNQQAYRGAHMAEELGYATLFDHSFYSFQLGCAKPSASYFEHVVDALGLPADQLLFLDDHAANVEAARGVGLHARRFVHGRSPRAADSLASVLAQLGLPVAAPG